jgi:hypothetical protein
MNLKRNARPSTWVVKVVQSQRSNNLRVRRKLIKKKKTDIRVLEINWNSGENRKLINGLD